MITRNEEVSIKEKRIQKLIDEKNLDGVLLRKQNNFTWFTAGAYNMVWVVTEIGMTSILITKSGRYLLSNKIETPRMQIEEGLQELQFELLEYEWSEDREAEFVKKIAGPLEKVGCDSIFQNCIYLYDEIKELRYSLTENEVERYMFLGMKTSEAAEKVLLGVRPGDKECEVAGRVAEEIWRDRIDPVAFMVAADDRVYKYRHPIPTDRMIQRYVMLCVNARFKGLITTITRILHIGKPQEKLLKQFTDNVEIECRMIEASKPGQACPN
jgi:Xaa-Pro dipeptidase